MLGIPCWDDFQYTLNVANPLSSETDTISGTGTTTNYGYDASNQVTTAGGASYSFDANGNRSMNGYQTGPDNQLTSDGTWNYKYDPAGNLVEKDGISNGLTWKYAYSNANQLTVVAEYSGGTLQAQVSYFYDVFGNQVEQDVTQSGTTTVTKFLHDQSGNAFADLNSSNQVQTMRVYLDAADAVFARIAADGTEAWYLAGHLGSVRGLINNSGSLIDAVTLDAFGNLTNETVPTSGDRFKFQGGELDPVSGLYRFGVRQYSPATGRWTTLDPKGFAAGDSNLYRMTGNNPVNNVDPSGLDSTPADVVDGLRTIIDSDQSWPEAKAWASAVLAMMKPGLSWEDVLVALGPMPRPKPAAPEPVVNMRNDGWARAAAWMQGTVETGASFSAGFVVGVAGGVWSFAEGVVKLVADLPDSVTTILTGIGALVNGLVTLNGDNVTLGLETLFPDLYALVKGWPDASDYQRGYLAGKVVGVYGAAILTSQGISALLAQINGMLAMIPRGPSLAPIGAPPIPIAGPIAIPAGPIGNIIGGGGSAMSRPSDPGNAGGQGGQGGPQTPPDPVTPPEAPRTGGGTSGPANPQGPPPTVGHGPGIGGPNQGGGGVGGVGWTDASGIWHFYIPLDEWLSVWGQPPWTYPWQWRNPAAPNFPP